MAGPGRRSRRRTPSPWESPGTDGCGWRVPRQRTRFRFPIRRTGAGAGRLPWWTAPALAPSSKQPYDWVGDDYNTFLEGPDDTLMLGVGARNLPWYYQDPDLLQDGLVRPDADIGGLFLIRSTDGGASWGDPTLMHPFVCEVGLAADPFNPDRILAMTRIQRPLLAGEDRESTLEKTGCPDEVPSPEPSIYKNGLLLESHDRGRTFREVPGSLTGYYEHRGTIL